MAFTKRHGTVALLDSGGTTIQTFTDVGDFTLDGIEEGNRASVPIFNRDAYAGDVEGQDTPHTGSFSYRIARESLTEAAADRPLDAIIDDGNHDPISTDNPIATGPTLVQVKYTLSDGTNSASVTVPQCRVKLSIDESGETLMGRVEFVGHGALVFT